MKLILHDFGGYPFSAQLARALAARGHEVRYLHAAGFKSPRVSLDGSQEDLGSLTFEGIDAGPGYTASAGPRRFAHERRYGMLLAASIERAAADAVLSANCPLDAQAIALEASHACGAGFGFWLQDVYSIAVGRMLRRRLGPIGTVIGARYERLERRVLREADAVIPIADDFTRLLYRWNVPADRITPIENWAPLDTASVMPRDNEWARRHGLVSRQTVVYAGTLGRKHDPRVLVELARGLPRATVVVVSEGSGAERLLRMSTPENMILLPLQPADELPSILGSADILVALLDRDAHEFSIPSKVLTYLTAGRAILAAMPPENLASRTILAARAGIVVDPDDRVGAARAAAGLMADASRRDAYGRAGRVFAERTFDIQLKTSQFEAVLQRIARRGHSQEAAKVNTASAH